MDSSTPTTPETPPENNDLSAEMFPTEEDLPSGNGRLALIAGGIVAAVFAGYMLLPNNITQSVSSPDVPTATMKLDEARVNNVSTSETQTAATPAVAVTSVAKPTETDKTAPVTVQTTAVRTVAATPTTAAAESEEPALAPVLPAAPIAVADLTETAPTTLNMSGRVLDENGRPLAGATILLKGSKAATSTDANGNYSLEVPAGTENTLLYGYGGYEDQVLRARNAKTQIVTLLPKEGSKRRRR